MENHSAIRTWALLAQSHPSWLLLMGPWVQLGSLHLLASTWPTEPFPQLCIVFSIHPQAAIDKRELRRFSRPKSCPKYEDTVSFSSVCISLWQGSGVDLPDFPFTVMQSSFNDKWPHGHQYISPLLPLYSSPAHCSTELHICSPSTTHNKGVDALWNILTPLQRLRTE